MTDDSEQIRISGVDMADWISRIAQSYYDRFANRVPLVQGPERMHQLELAGRLTDDFAHQVTQAMLTRQDVLDALIDIEGIRSILRGRAEQEAEARRQEEDRQAAAQERRRKKLAQELAALQDEGGGP